MGTRPSLETQPVTGAVVRGVVADYWFRDALPENLRGVYDRCLVNGQPPEVASAELRVSPGFVAWAMRTSARRLTRYTALISGPMPMSREMAAKAANKPGQPLQ